MSKTIATDVDERAEATAVTLEFSAIEHDMVSIVGGKAANLGVLTRAGFPVPPGICVTTYAYRLAVSSSVLNGIVEELATANPYDAAQITELSARARAAVLSAPVPHAIEVAVLRGYAGFGDNVPVAVRSSATAEDLPNASFAGQQDTYLNVIGSSNVLKAVRQCWSSLWTERAVVYRSMNGIDHRSVSVAVVVQRMVDAVTAGVLFTANPVTGKRRQAVIDASPGLGEAVVSGAVNPDRFVVDTETGNILDRRPGDKRVSVRALPDGGTQHIQSDARYEACISDQQIRQLVALGDAVEFHYGKPQDTEWAIDAEGTVWLTQARPITTLFPLPAKAPRSEDELRVYFCFSVAQGLYRPITPMGMAAFRLLASAVSEILGFPVENALSGPARFAEAGERVFVDLTGVLRSRSGRTIMPRVLDIMESRSAELLRELVKDPRLDLTRKSWISFVRRLVRIAVRYRVPVTAFRSLIKPDSALKRAEDIALELAERLRVPKGVTAMERLDFVEKILSDDCVSMVPQVMPAAAMGMALHALAGSLLRDHAQPDELQAVLRGLPNNVTTKMDLELWSLASRIKCDAASVSAFRERSIESLGKQFHAGTLPRTIQTGLTEFLAIYGHRGVAEIDLGVPRWSEDPRHILGVLANYLQLEEASRAPDVLFERGAQESDTMIAELSHRASRQSSLRGWIVRFALGRARKLVGMRELPKFYVVVALSAARVQLGLVGQALVEKGALENEDDIFFVDLVDARQGLGGKDLRAIVRERRGVYALELHRRHVPRILLSNGLEPEALSSIKDDGALSGTPASAGRITGTARVILDPVGAQLLPGEILVAPSTDPGWTPLFLTAGGLVMEMGGSNSHGAVVAREYGIPAVVGVKDVTLHIKTGQQITIDGGAGTVVVAQ